MNIEPLEHRIAPAILVNPTTVQYADDNGDTVIVKISKGAFNGVVGAAPDVTDFIFAPSGGGEVLQRIDLANDFEFHGAKLTITAAGGDGLANIGYIDAQEIDLAEVSIKGDLGRIDVGDGVVSTTGLGKLKLESFGQSGIATQEPGGNLVTNINGRLGELFVKGDVVGAEVNVIGGPAGKIGKVTIGRDLLGTGVANSGEISAGGDIGPVKIGRDLKAIDPAGTSSGRIDSGGNIASVSIGRDLLAGADSSGQIRAQGNIGAIFIGGDLRGGSGVSSGFIETDQGGNIASITILGSLVGGGDSDSGKIQTDGGGNIGPVKIGTDPAIHGIFGGGGSESGAIEVDDGGTIASVTIFGSVVGGTNSDAGSIQLEDNGEIGPVVIKGDLIGNSGPASGTIRIADNGSIKSVTIGGKLQGGSGQDSGSVQTGDLGNIGPVKIGLGIFGGSDEDAGSIRAPEGSIKSVTVGGPIEGFTGGRSGAIFASSDIGPVAINGGGNLLGGTGDESGSIISAFGNIVSVKISGSLIGGSGNVSDTGVITARNGNVVKVAITGNLLGGDIAAGQSATNTGAILGENIGSVTIGGSIASGTDSGNTLVNSGAIRAAHQLKSLKVDGTVMGNATHFVTISGRGQLNPSATTDLAIGSVKLGSDVSFTNILAGVGQNGTELNPDAQIGEVKVAGDWFIGNIAAGISPTDGFFGNPGDASIVGTPGADTAIVSKIASITIGGFVNGTIPGGDSSGFVAEHVVKVTIRGVPVVLTAGAQNDLVPVSVDAGTVDVFVLEVI